MKVQKRKSISVSPQSYLRLKLLSVRHRISMSKLTEDMINKYADIDKIERFTSEQALEILKPGPGNDPPEEGVQAP